MPAQQGHAPTTAELQAYGLGKLDPQRACEVEAYLAEHPELASVLAAAPDDEVVQHLRGAGALPRPRARSPLLRLAVEAVVPVLGGCAGALAGGAVGGLVGVVLGQVAEKGINCFGPHIVNKWLEWWRGQPPASRVVALAELADIPPEVARNEVTAALAEEAPHVSDADRQVAIDYLSAIPRSVRRSLLSDRERGGRTLPPTVSADDPRTLLQLLPADVPPYPVPTALPSTDIRLEELIGSGGFGAVYRASSPSFQCLAGTGLAIKFCLDRSLLPVLRQERANLEQLMRAGGEESWSPRIVRLYGCNLEHCTPYLVYEFVSGGDLVHWLAARQARFGRGLAPAEVLELITQVAEALTFVHARGLVHRDLKPANVLMSGETIKLADFGIGGVVSRQAGQTSRIGTAAAGGLCPAEQVSLLRGAGTPLYMSDEQRDGKGPDPRDDVYSLGVMWYQLLVGDVTRKMGPGWRDELVEEHGVPTAHVETINKCVGLFKHRPENAGKVLEVLRGLAAPVTTPQTDAGLVKPPAPQEAALSGDKPQALREEVMKAIVAVDHAAHVPDWFKGFWILVALGSCFLLYLLLRDFDSAKFWLKSFLGMVAVTAVAAIMALDKRRRQTRENLAQAISSASDALSLPVAVFDRSNTKSLCMAGLHLAGDIAKRYLQRNTSARVHMGGGDSALIGLPVVMLERSINVSLDGELLGEGSLKDGFDLPALLCHGTHYLEMRWANRRVGDFSFEITREGSCRVEVAPYPYRGVTKWSVEVFWLHSA